MLMKKNNRTIALLLLPAFISLLWLTAMPLPARPQAGEGGSSMENAETAPSYVEKEQQIGFQSARKSLLPILLITAAVAAGIFLLVIAVSKIKYNIGGVWDFNTHYTTAGGIDYDSVWTFLPYDDLNPIMGTFRRVFGNNIYEGFFTVVDKTGVVFQDEGSFEEHVGAFDSKTTMSGTFQDMSGAKGTWTARKRSN